MTKDKSIFIKNIYYMLSYAFQTLNQENYDDVAAESFDEMYDLLAAILAKGIGIQLKQGLYREYINRQEELPVMRGKINLPGTIKNRLVRKQLLTCDYDELSENNLLNQIIKTAVMLLLRNAKVKAEYKDDLKKKMLFFSDVDKLEPTSIRWSSIRFQRNNQTYRMLISICQLIIEGMLITTDAGEYRLASFVDEQRMCRLYEKFILEYYSKHFPELSVSASQIPWSVDDGIRTMLPVMQSDIHLQKGNTVLIIDAKYYSHTTQALICYRIKMWSPTRLMAIPFWLFMYQELNVSRSLFILITIYLVAAIVEIGKATIIAQRQKLKVCSVMLRMRQRI